jgi:hypothetical protein
MKVQVSLLQPYDLLKPILYLTERKLARGVESDE